jgi:serine/threonine protein kinase
MWLQKGSSSSSGQRGRGGFNNSNNNNNDDEDKRRPGARKKQSSGGEFILGTTLLGTGSFSQVKLGQELTTGQTVAVKIMEKSKLGDYDRQCIGTEIAILRRLRHRHVVQYLDDFSDDAKSFIVLEYVPGGNLFQLLKSKGGRLSENEARRIMVQLLRAVEYCHEQGVVHRDLKVCIVRRSYERVIYTDFFFFFSFFFFAVGARTFGCRRSCQDY